MSLFPDTRDPIGETCDGVTRLFYRGIKTAYRVQSLGLYCRVIVLVGLHCIITLGGLWG